MSWENNPYYRPEALGLTTVGEFDWAEPDYSFDMLVVWKDASGQFWIGQDSGCSCPSPFEEVNDLNELDGPYDADGLRKRVDWLINDRVGDRPEGGYYLYSKAQLQKSASEIYARL